MIVVWKLHLRVLAPEVGQRVEDLRDRHPLTFPLQRARRWCVHGLCHSLPSASSSFAAPCGPHVPAAYICSGGRPPPPAAPVGAGRGPAGAAPVQRGGGGGVALRDPGRLGPSASGAV